MREYAIQVVTSDPSKFKDTNMKTYILGMKDREISSTVIGFDSSYERLWDYGPQTSEQLAAMYYLEKNPRYVPFNIAYTSYVTGGIIGVIDKVVTDKEYFTISIAHNPLLIERYPNKHTTSGTRGFVQSIVQEHWKDLTPAQRLVVAPFFNIPITRDILLSNII